MYFITTIDSRDDDMRCVGYYPTFKMAEKVVLNNTCDLWETCYDYCVIEHIDEGLYIYDPYPTWYKWDDIKEKYEKIENKPEKYKHMIGFSIG